MSHHGADDIKKEIIRQNLKSLSDDIQFEDLLMELITCDILKGRDREKLLCLYKNDGATKAMESLVMDYLMRTFKYNDGWNKFLDALRAVDRQNTAEMLGKQFQERMHKRTGHRKDEVHVKKSEHKKSSNEQRTAHTTTKTHGSEGDKKEFVKDQKRAEEKIQANKSDGGQPVQEVQGDGAHNVSNAECGVGHVYENVPIDGINNVNEPGHYVPNITGNSPGTSHNESSSDNVSINRNNNNARMQYMKEVDMTEKSIVDSQESHWADSGCDTAIDLSKSKIGELPSPTIERGEKTLPGHRQARYRSNNGMLEFELEEKNDDVHDEFSKQNLDKNEMQNAESVLSFNQLFSVPAPDFSESANQILDPAVNSNISSANQSQEFNSGSLHSIENNMNIVSSKTAEYHSNEDQTTLDHKLNWSSFTNSGFMSHGSSESTNTSNMGTTSSQLARKKNKRQVCDEIKKQAILSFRANRHKKSKGNKVKSAVSDDEADSEKNNSYVPYLGILAGALALFAIFAITRK